MSGPYDCLQCGGHGVLVDEPVGAHPTATTCPVCRGTGERWLAPVAHQPPEPPAAELAARIRERERAVIEPLTPCIRGEGRVHIHSGHLRRYHNGRDMLAHRVAWIEKHGAIADGLCVLHRCDNPACINVEHLFLGTRGDNNRDCAAKERNARGEINGAAKLTAALVLQIKAGLEAGKSMRALSREFGVAYSTIHPIREGRTWTHITGGPTAHPNGRRQKRNSPPRKP